MSDAQPVTYPIPDGVRVVTDEVNQQWTDVPGAVALSGRSRRTIYHWMKNGWVVVRRRASNRPEILVASLYQSEPAREALP